MGLDQYLYRRLKSSGEPSEDNSELLVTWRKFNALQHWMVMRFADGVDTQQEFPVTMKDIAELTELLGGIRARKRNPELLEDGDSLEDYCSRILPTQDGFFFGPTEYDEGYFDDIEYTLEQLQTVLQHWDEDYIYWYTSWW